MKPKLLTIGVLLTLAVALSACAGEEKATPAPTSTAPASPAAWQQEWDQVVAAAKKEGKVVVAGPPEAEYRRGLTGPFEQKYGISVEYMGETGAVWGGRIRAEREAGQYLWDIHVGGNPPMFTVLKPMGAMDRIEPALILPELKDPKTWREGKVPFADNDHQILEFSIFTTTSALMVNSNLVKPGEIKSYKDLLDPKWKGKIMIHDPRVAGPGQAAASFFYEHKDLGPDFLRALLKHDPIMGRDSTQQLEWLAQGRYPLLVGGSVSAAMAMEKQGLPIRQADPRQIKEGGSTASGFSNVTLINRAPHPNAAKLYLNWLLSKEAQTELSRTLGYASMRVDGPTDHVEPLLLPFESAWAGGRGEASIPAKARVAAFAREILGD
ncbi:MAG TPA: extracellular solute-binding protein [Dehalococcoidia bacterium]|nr:extracellular solute-binding protein [Dehalococcoidia bacterium]